MSGESNLNELIRGMNPDLHAGEFVFTSQSSTKNIPPEKIIGQFTEKEGTTVIMEKSLADDLGLSYEFIAAWITLTVRSSLDAVGLTAAVASELTRYGISCNVVAAYYHDHIFVDKIDAKKALQVLMQMAEKHK